METFYDKEHTIISDEPLTFTPDYQKKIRIGIENIAIELQDTKIRTFLTEYVTLIGKTYYPGKRYHNTYFITGTRVNSCTSIKHHLTKHIYKFGRHLRIRYDNQPIQNSQQQNEEVQQETELDQPTIQPQQQLQEENSEDEHNSQQKSEDEHQTSEDEQQNIPVTQTQYVPQTQKDLQEKIPTPNTHDTPNIENDEEPFITIKHRKKRKTQVQTPITIQNDHQSTLWWKIPLGERKEPKYKMNPNELYHKISPEQKERYYTKKTENQYGAPLLKDCERRLRGRLRRLAPAELTCTESEQS